MQSMQREMSKLVLLVDDFQRVVTNLEAKNFTVYQLPEKRRELRRLKKEMLEVIGKVPIMELTTV